MPRGNVPSPRAQRERGLGARAMAANDGKLSATDKKELEEAKMVVDKVIKKDAKVSDRDLTQTLSKAVSAPPGW